MDLHLFVKKDGFYQGRLAALLCCCAAVNEDEHPIEKRNISKPTTARNTIWNEQPTPLKPMPYFPTHSSSSSFRDTYNKGVDAAFDEDDRVRPISERPPSLRPLSFGEPSLLDRMHLHSRRKSSTNLQMRISIGRPTDFRRLEYTEKQRLSFKQLQPLQLSPVVLRDVTPEADFSETSMNRNRSVDDLTDPAHRDSYRASRGTPFERCQLLTSSPSSSMPSASVTARGQIIIEPVKPQQLSTKSSSGSIRSLRRQAIESSASSVSTPSRPSSERIRLKRKRSSQKTSGDSSDLDKEILELNTIVEEHRAESAKQKGSGDGHVAAVAPLMSVRARSETLTDIGSAFSRPLISVSTSTPVPGTALEEVVRTVSPVEAPVKSRLSRPLDMPDPIAFEQAAQQEQPQRQLRRPNSKVSGWLSNLLGSSNHSGSTSANDSCQTSLRGRAISETSLCTTGTELESPMASTPMSKGGHSRSLTAESRLTPVSPPSTVDEDPEPVGQGKDTEPWPLLVRHPSQVGLAF